MELLLCHSPLPLPLPVPAPRCCSGSVFYGVLLGCRPPPPQFRSPHSGLGILGPPPRQPPPADLQEDGGAASPPPPGFELVVSWRPPPDGWVKLNTDGSFVGRGSSGGAGFVARDSEGLFVFAGASSCPGVNPLYSELWAIRAALTRAIEAGFPRVLLESDSSSAVDLLGGRIKNANAAPRGTKRLVQDCLALRCRFREIIIQHTYREGNRVADRLAALGRRSGQDRFYLHFDDLPDAVTRDRILSKFGLIKVASIVSLR
ncbi:putative ribonuclease H protein [Ananas comosus]|uniref:Putative ribonuclease H protein n=1 Tax=Ananas comosus TaxID=4615 RepID=A0A199W0X5_ANACO|nr:putative ribonuclease H protein [Ananas comosus]